jgi:hypothetical protein
MISFYHNITIVKFMFSKDLRIINALDYKIYDILKCKDLEISFKHKLVSMIYSTFCSNLHHQYIILNFIRKHRQSVDCLILL